MSLFPHRLRAPLGTALSALALVLVLLSVANTARANALWSFTATIGSAVGGDTEQLAGATLSATYRVDLPANYMDFFGASYAPVNQALTSITISGSGNPANNATFAPTILFAGTFLGFAPNAFGGGSAQIVSDGLQAVTLPSGNTLTFGPTIASLIANPAPGSAVSLAHFPTGMGVAGSLAPAVNLASTAETYNGTTATFSLVPEPGSLALLVSGAAVLVVRRRSPVRIRATRVG